MNVFSEALPLTLYSAEQVRQLDRVAIGGEGIPGLTLMRRAGRAVFDIIVDSFPAVEKITVFCGTGNNGGDGYVVATLARQQGVGVEVIQVGDPQKIGGDALQARELALQDGVPVIPFAQAQMPSAGVIVDGLLGTGLSGDVRGDSAKAIAAINGCDLPVVAIDIPSGLCSDRGMVLGEAVRVEHTVTFIGCKQGLLTGDAPDYVGALHFDDLSVPHTVFEQVAYSVDRLDMEVLSSLLPARPATAHKGRFGHVLVIGGDHGMAGAALMAAQSAGRVGAGLVSCATRPEHVPALVSRCPEVMAHAVVSGQELERVAARASVIVVGPGLGREPWGEQLLQQASQLELPMVVDADALNLLSEGRVVRRAQRDDWILTPHPGEAARLLGCDTRAIQADRFAAVAELQQRFGGAVVLKGAGTLVAAPEYPRIGLCPYGNPGMASGGMGDVLSGILGALLAQGLSPGQSARLGVCLHACAADLASEEGQRGMLATDLLSHLRSLVNLA